MSQASWTVLAVVAALLGLVTIGAAVMTDYTSKLPRDE